GRWTSISSSGPLRLPGFGGVTRPTLNVQGPTLSRQPLECLLQIRQQIAGVFHAAGKADQAVAETERGPSLGRNRRMRHPGRLADQRLHPAQRLGQGEHPDPLEYVRCALTRAELDADHASEPRHLPPGERVLGMGRQADVVDVLRPYLLDEPARDLAAVEVVLPHAEVQGLRAAEREPGVE